MSRLNRPLISTSFIVIFSNRTLQNLRVIRETLSTSVSSSCEFEIHFKRQTSPILNAYHVARDLAFEAHEISLQKSSKLPLGIGICCTTLLTGFPFTWVVMKSSQVVSAVCSATPDLRDSLSQCWHQIEANI